MRKKSNDWAVKNTKTHLTCSSDLYFSNKVVNYSKLYLKDNLDPIVQAKQLHKNKYYSINTSNKCFPWIGIRYPTFYKRTHRLALKQFIGLLSNTFCTLEKAIL